ncbi:diguanylate cyclase [Aquicoccus porphyridii]|uniref:Diguanylate cyclase n=1 Tax=Aquicoccus porphyridii TaxID=1852029 RepID=A0A5A9Z8I0_9RHOB|nr:PAS-domain containing protein [Aquicoccus porphyridii]KAA0913255.1 diguanylate cyclase [Aquicoccus porphyridii]
MAGLGLWGIAALVAICTVAAGLALALFALLERRGTGRPNHAAPDPVAFLFDGEQLDHASEAAQTILARTQLDGDPTDPFSDMSWNKVSRILRPRFPDLPRSAAQALQKAPCTIPADNPQDHARLDLVAIGGKLSVAIMGEAPPCASDHHLTIIQTSELRAVARAANLFPYPIWISRTDGQVIWANAAHAKLTNNPRLLSEQGQGILSTLDLDIPETSDETSQRVAVETGDPDRADWFSVTKMRSGQNGFLNFAIDINPVVEAEIAQHRFVQTLTKTFAQLSTGLAIFDRDRQLALFNPALIDLTALPAEFLSARPDLQSFFDRLRDNRMMPEPKNYASWRQHIADLVVAASDGRYHETWSLPSGLTYRVTGRPHPDGAIAILIEDISAEMSLTRRFRSQLDLGQAVIDTLDEGIVAFSPTGALTLSNTAFCTMWKLDPESSFAEMTAQDATRHMRAMCTKTDFWTDLREFLPRAFDRHVWFTDIRMKDGTPIECRVAPISGGETLVSFRLRPVLQGADASANVISAPPG